MILFKASGTTYRRVVTQERHAFPFSPSEVRPHEFVLLSKNREDCRPTENQIQHVAKVLGIEAVAPAVIEQQFPNVTAGARWSYLAKLYWSRPLKRSFNLSQVVGLNAKRYATVQEFARLDEGDEIVVFNFLLESNPETILDFVNMQNRLIDSCCHAMFHPDPPVSVEDLRARYDRAPSAERRQTNSPRSKHGFLA